MRILRITLRNIASIAGTHTVDFTTGALLRTGLYVICGATGSGKSTLLDALCLALYERTPRLELAPAKSNLEVYGEIIAHRDPGNLLRRGSWEGFAEVAFIGVDGGTYTARWSIRRARNKPDGKLQSPDMVLYSGDVREAAGTPLLAGKRTEVKPVIAEKVGLSYEQFTRAVLLSQNDFAAFLKAQDRDRAEILQELTGTARFEELSIQVFNRHRDERERVHMLEAELKGNQPLDPESRQAAETELSSAQTAHEEAEAAHKLRETQAAWFADLRKLTHAEAAAQTALTHAETAQREAASRRQELDLTAEADRAARPLAEAETRTQRDQTAAQTALATAQESETAASQTAQSAEQNLASAEDRATTATRTLTEAKPLLRTARELDSQLATLRERLEAATAARQETEVTLRGWQAQHETLLQQQATVQKELAALEPRRQALAHLEPFAAESTAWLERFAMAATTRQAAREAEAQFTARQQAESKSSQEHETRQSDLTQAQRSLATLQADLNTAQTQSAAFDGEQIAARRDTAGKEKTALETLEKSLQYLARLTQDADQLREELRILKSDNSQEALELEALRHSRIPAAEAACTAAQRAYDLAAAAVEEAAIKYRALLVAGQPCPVCGSPEHPNAEHADGAALRALKADWVSKGTACREVTARAMALENTARERQERIQQKSLAAAELDERREKGRAIIAKQAEACHLKHVPEDEQLEAAAARLEELATTLRTLETEDARRREADRLFAETRTRYEASRQAASRLEAGLAQLTTALALATAARAQAATNLEKALQASESADRAIQPLLAALPHTDRSRLAQEFAVFTKIHQSLRELSDQLRSHTEKLVPLQDQLAQGTELLEKRRSAEEAARKICDETAAQRAQHFTGRPADEVEADLEQAALAAQESAQKLRSDLAEARSNLAAVRAAREAAAHQCRQSQAAAEEAAAALGTWLHAFATRHQRTFTRLELTTLLARDALWLQAERAALDALDQAVTHARGALTAQQTNLQAHAATRPTAEPEEQVLADLAARSAQRASAAERLSAARTHLAMDDERTSQNAALAEKLTAVRAAFQPWEELNALIGSADGAKFRTIAQERTLDILLSYANAQLAQLSARYALERVRDSLNLIVIDRDMGDERRSVHSLSGGESFLVSLALALGLASLTSNRLRIESLFIDEGFGSLDPETLAIALNALTQLESQGRKVGVISHVAELAEAIPTQIKVVKGRSGASRLLLPGDPPFATD